ncbi:lamin tail domain-containing protein [Kibdelosporangium aridum]|uniref:LTD domain-containing protein n=1 Tax=Kibdelosporangium aridum TaxID=2030 RepID=A0A1W2FEG1_KIBAR|nr:lamin tail domain-containing protein [Kibdelosporangium aridum]SMD20435.1 hypothetical protein SAMN05661093_06428 [Kibdelosporangium aridum]
MKRTISAVLAAGIAVLGLVGLGGTANASEPQGQHNVTQIIPEDIFISEIATRLNGLPNPEQQEFIEICNRSTEAFTVPMGGFRVRATFSAAERQGLVVDIPAGTVLQPGQAFVIASPFYTLTTPDLVFSTPKSIPDLTGFQLLHLWQNVPEDVVGTAPTTITPFVSPPAAKPLTPTDPQLTSLTRVNFTGINALDFVKQQATPGYC